MLSGVIYATLAALGDIAGGALVLWRAPQQRRVFAVLTGFGAGFMLTVVVLGMLPATINAPGGFAAVLIGYLIVHLTQHTLTPHFHFGEETHADAMISRDIGLWALVGLLPHSFFDGVAISSGFLQSAGLGVLVFIGMLAHKVPTGISLGSVMLASGNTPRRTMLAVTAIGVATIAGAAITPIVAPIAEYGLALAAGVTLYVAASNLIPETQRERSWPTQAGLVSGVVAFVLLEVLMPIP